MSLCLPSRIVPLPCIKYSSYHEPHVERADQCPLFISPYQDQSNASQHTHAYPSSHPLLTRLSLHLLRRTLSTLLALDRSPARCSTLSCLRLLSLLRALSCCLLVLRVLQCGVAGGFAGFWALRTALLDDVEGGADDGSLVLDCTAGALLCYLLWEGVNCCST
jgi:hypothetical protein